MNWIKVSDRLPAHDQRADLLTKHGNRIVDAEYHRSEGGYWSTPGGVVHAEITHWMPLPEPPEDE